MSPVCTTLRICPEVYTMVRMLTTISIKTDKAVKQAATATAKRIGIPLSTLINAYLREFAATGRVEFTAAEQMTPQMERIIKQAETEIAHGDTLGPFDSVDELMSALRS